MNNSRLYKLMKEYTRNVKYDMPEAILFGSIKLCLMPNASLEVLIAKEPELNIEAIKKSIKEAEKFLEGEGYDVDLMKKGLPLLVKFVPQREGDDYSKIVEKYDVNTSFVEILKDAVYFIKKLDSKELETFKVGKSLEDVMGYRDSLLIKETDDLPFKESEVEKKAEEPKKESPKKSKDKDKDKDKEEKDSDTEAEVEAATESESEEDKSTDEIEEESLVYSEALNEYLSELDDMIPTFKDMGNERFLWSQTLLLSMDDGFGMTTFGKKIAKIFIKNDLAKCDTKEPTDIFSELLIDHPDSRDGEMADWNKAVAMIRSTERRASFRRQSVEEIDDKNKLTTILCLDISKWTSDMNTHKVKECLRKLNEKKENTFIIFRIPYMDRRIVAQIEADISDIMGVRTLVAPPVSTEIMTDYLIERGRKNGYTIEPDCREYLEKGIIAEKNDGKYYGFRTLDKMFDSIIYEKIKYNYHNSLSDKIITAEQIRNFVDVNGVNEESVEDMIRGLVGVDDIIKEIDDKIKQIKISQQMAENGNSVERPSIHMMFKGSPGTGKTTIARVVAKKLKDAGILSKGNLYEIKGRDLCGRYIGETTPKTAAYCRDAYGSVLFIDEAYELYRGADNTRDYGREALTALIAEMENHRDDMCVILAGYSDEMDTLMEGNIGLESRIPIIIDFPNYTKDELENIFFNMMDKNFKYEDELKEKVHEFFENIPDNALKAKDFANARFVRNLFENVWGAASLRQDLAKGGHLVIKSCDFDAATKKIDFGKHQEKFRPVGPIGFRV